MTVESASFISDLNSSYPAATDAKSEGDDHLRLIKSAVKATFPNVTAAVTPTHTQLNYVTGVTSAIQTQLDAKAPLASPALTGTPTAPTASTGTGTTQLATTAFVSNAILASSGITATLPGQGGNAGKFLTTDGSTASWGTAGDVTLTGTQTLTNKTLSTGTALSATVTGNDSLLTRVMLQDTGWDYYDSSTTNALDYVNGSVQRWAPNTGSQTLSITNWPPSGAMGELLIQGVNLGAATITWPTINWIKSDGTTTTTFASNGVTLQTSGTDWVFLWTRDAGTTIYGKVVR